VVWFAPAAEPSLSELTCVIDQFFRGTGSVPGVCANEESARRVTPPHTAVEIFKFERNQNRLVMTI
jgi:hypothetical protein